MTVANRFKERRLERGLTQEEAARLMGVTRQTIIAIEKGNYVPSVLLALVGAKVFGCRVEDIFYVDESR
ncbi:MAG: helix-turn-helix transcriptional regulator [Rectinemataceae bacterium]